MDQTALMLMHLYTVNEVRLAPFTVYFGYNYKCYSGEQGKIYGSGSQTHNCCALGMWSLPGSHQTILIRPFWMDSTKSSLVGWQECSGQLICYPACRKAVWIWMDIQAGCRTSKQTRLPRASLSPDQEGLCVVPGQNREVHSPGG